MKRKKHILLVTVISLLVLAIFLTAASIEYRRQISEKKENLQNQVYFLTASINQFVNQSVRYAEGVVAYVQTYPDQDQAVFSDYVARVMPKDDEIISHFTAIKDTTIAFVFPEEGNMAAIGVDLSTIEGQKEDILQIKNDRITMFVGPVDLVQGGTALIYRMPIILDDNSYWGQLSMVIRYNEMLRAAGIQEFANNHKILIEQQESQKHIVNHIYKNAVSFSSDAITTEIAVPNGRWRITTEYKNGLPGFSGLFYALIVLGLCFSSFVGYIIYLLLESNVKLTKRFSESSAAFEETNEALLDSQAALKATQDQLVDKEKSATLTSMVASIAHEINNPLGVCVTVNSFVGQLNQDAIKKFESGTLKRSDLESTMTQIKESSSILQHNLERASQLVFSFKKLATDQYLDEYQAIDLKEYVDYILKAISPKLKGTQHSIDNNMDNGIQIETYPSAMFQILTNLILNSLIHGFKEKDQGKISITGQRQENQIIMDYYDDGKGIPPLLSTQVFEPFYTTNKEEGGTGLGMHIIKDLIENQLHGSIELRNDTDAGVHFRMKFPVKAKEEANA